MRYGCEINGIEYIVLIIIKDKYNILYLRYIDTCIHIYSIDKHILSMFIYNNYTLLIYIN